MTYTENPDESRLRRLEHLNGRVLDALVAVRRHLEELWPPGSKVHVMLNSRQVNPSAGTIELWDAYETTARVVLDKPKADKYGFRKFPVSIRKRIHYRNIVK